MSKHVLTSRSLVGWVPLAMLVLAGLWLGTAQTRPQGLAPIGDRMVRGYIAAVVTRKDLELLPGPAHFGGKREVFVPAVSVFAVDISTKSASSAVQTDLSGRFTLRLPGGTRYQICWKANGFVPGCARTVTSVAADHVHLGTIRIAPNTAAGTTVVHGSVRLKDGSLPRALEPLSNINQFAEVSLLDSAGKTLSKTPVNTFGDYILPQVPVKTEIALRASIETVASDQKILPPANLNGAMFHNIDLTIGNTPPRVEPLFATDAAKRRVKVAAPGQTVNLAALTMDPDGDPLKMRWAANAGSGALSALTGPNVTWTLPKADGLYSVNLIAYDEKGGYTTSRLSLRADARGIPFSGRVEDNGGAAIAAARVEVNGRLTTTGASGAFQVYVPNAPKFVMNIRKPGFGLVSHIYDDSVTGGRWTMVHATVQTVDPANPIRVFDRRGDKRDCPGPLSSKLDWGRYKGLRPQFQDGRGNVIPTPSKFDGFVPLRERPLDDQTQCGPGVVVEIPANSIVDASGNAPAGNVSIAVATFDLNSPEQMPGDDTVLRPDGSTQVMQSYGAGAVEIFSGNRQYNLRQGTTARVTIPVDPSQLAAGGPLPPTIPLLSYDERRGVWIEEGTLTLAGTAYVGNARHFSAINSDLVKTNQSCIKVLSPTLPASYKLEFTIPQTGGAAPVVRTHTINNASPSRHVLYNLPSQTNITLIPVDLTTSIPIGWFVVNTGGVQNPQNPNLPADPYTACATSVTLTQQILPEVPTNGEFLHGLSSFEATNLDELDPADPTQAALIAAIDGATAAYYKQIDPRLKRLTFNDFKTTNGMGPGETRVIYANSTDLGFGRDMHCKKTGSDVACYVSNYGKIDTPDAGDVNDAIGGIGLVATVAMEYSRIESPIGTIPEFDDPDRTVKFYVYNSAGTLVRAADLDLIGARPIPQLCMVCHGGALQGGASPGVPPVFASRADVKLGSQFLPFDLNAYTFGPAPFDKASQQDEFKTLNETIVRNTPPDTVISDLITQWYSGSSLTQKEDIVIGGWTAQPGQRDMYKHVVGKTCRTCHVTNAFPPLRFDQATQMIDRLGSVEVRVCDQHVMPHAKVTHDKFWKSVGPNMVAQLQAFGDVFGTGLNGWSGNLCGAFTGGGPTPSFYNLEVQPILTSRCTGCHTGASPPGQLNLTAAVSFGNIVNKASVQVPGMFRITPSSEANSYLLHKLLNTHAGVGGVGAQMPADGTAPLNNTLLSTIKLWINNNALP